MDYKEAAELAKSGRTLIGGQKARKIGNNTFAVDRGDHVAIRLHSTDIMRFYPDGSVALDSGGWRTVTTKARFNEYLPGGWRISQERGFWKVARYTETGWSDEASYADGMTITAAGDMDYHGQKPQDPKAAAKLRARVKRYVDGYMTALEAGKVPAPGLGDCFYCGMRTTGPVQENGGARMAMASPKGGGAPLGEAFRDQSHILAHLSERYYVPSLIARAAEVFGVSKAAHWYLAGKWNGDNSGDSWGGIAKRQLGSALRRYILRQLGQAA